VDDFAKMYIFLEFPLSLVLDQILGNLNHFQNLYEFFYQTKGQLVASHLHVFDCENFSVLPWWASVFHKFQSIHTRACHSARMNQTQVQSHDLLVM